MQKVESLYPLLDKMGYSYYLPGIATEVKDKIIIQSTMVELKKEYPIGEIRYTTDGSEPTWTSPLYSQPIEVNQSTTLKAMVQYGASKKSKTATLKFTMQSPIPAVTPPALSPGLSYMYSEVSLTSIEKGWSSFKPTAKGTLALPTIPGFVRKDNWAIHLDGYLKVPKTGVYTFVLSSDDGSILYLNGKEMINYDGVHGSNARLRSVALSEGYHLFQLRYFEALYGESLKLLWINEEGKEEIIPSNLFFRKNKHS